MGAFEYENKEQFGKTMVNSDFPSDDFLWNNMGAGAMTRPEVTSYLIGEERASYIARFNYAFNNKYLLTANLRVDGSSNFAENKQWGGVFPGVSAAWRITEEPFLQNNKVINDLKLRADTVESVTMETLPEPTPTSERNTMLSIRYQQPDWEWKR